MRDMKLPRWAVDGGFAWPPHRPTMVLAQLSQRELGQFNQQQEALRKEARDIAEQAERSLAAE